MATRVRFLQVGAGDARDHAVYQELVRELDSGLVRMAVIGDNPLLLALPGTFRVESLEAAADAARRIGAETVLMWSPELLLQVERLGIDFGQNVLLGPTGAAVALEGSKVFCKRLLTRHGVPTPEWEAVAGPEACSRLERSWSSARPWVIKSDRYLSEAHIRTAVPSSLGDARRALERLLAVGPERRGRDVLFERRVDGEELSLHLLMDGTSLVVAPPVADYKRLHDGDLGPNTHGMGAVSGLEDPQIRSILDERIVDPLRRLLVDEGLLYRGVLYVGVVWGAEGPTVLELNIRPGNPEFPTLLARLRGRLSTVLREMAHGHFSGSEYFSDDVAALSAFVTQPGYPEACGEEPSLAELGLPVSVAQNVSVLGEGLLAHDGRLRVGRRRSVCFVARAASVHLARESLYHAMRSMGSDVGHYRRDIGLGRRLAGSAE